MSPIFVSLDLFAFLGVGLYLSVQRARSMRARLSRVPRLVASRDYPLLEGVG